MTKMDAVELGFIKKTASWKLRSKYFPSKVGGKPSWLALKNIPEPSDLACKTCGNPCLFLLQVYANVDENADAFHRCLFIFMCANGKCIKRFSNKNFLVFRSQLPRRNEFYSFDPPVMEEKSSNEPSASDHTALCEICGCKAILQCEKSCNTRYCCDFHRLDHWNRGHKDTCGTGIGTKKKKTSNPYILPEFEIESDTEYLPSEKPEKSDAEKMQEYREFMSSSKAPNELQDVPLDDLDSVMKKNDKAFNKFRKRVEYNPEQILRYQRGGKPLMVSAEGVPKESDVPPCICGSKRIFEFQIMSQLLLYLSIDSVTDSPDWGTLLIYTCSESCGAATAEYVQEFLWKQDFSITE